MKKLNLLFVTIGIAILALIGCSKKNVFGKTNDGSNTGNGVGNLIISPTPATYGNTIRITSVAKNTKFTNDDIEVFFTSNTNPLLTRYNVNPTAITIISGKPDTLQFVLPSDIPMDGYLVKVVYNKTNDTLIYNGYAVLDADLIKNAVVVSKLTPNSVDINDNANITISGNNFSSDASKDTVILSNNDGIEIYRWNGANITNATSTAISFSIPKIAKLISDIKTGTTYDVKIKVDGKNSDQTGLQSLTITNREYPTFSYSTKQDGTNAGTFVTLLSGWDNTKQVYFSKINSTASTQIIAVNNNGSFFMPQNIDADNYYIKIKQDGNSYLTAIDATTKDSVVIVKPFVTDIAFSANNGSINIIPIDYPFDFTNKDSVFDITIKGANLVKNSAVAFDINATPSLTGTPTPTITSETEIVYKQFSTLTQAGNIKISISNNATELTNKSFAFYKPVITGINNDTYIYNDPNTPSFIISGRGLLGTTHVVLSNNGNEFEIPATVKNDQTINLDYNQITNLALINNIPYNILSNTNGVTSNILLNALRKVNDGIPTLLQINTLLYTQAYVYLEIKGNNFNNLKRIKILGYTNKSTNIQAPPIVFDRDNGDFSVLDDNTIKLRLDGKIYGENRTIILGYNDENNVYKELSSLPFVCIKAVNMLSVDKSVSFTLYSSLLDPGSGIYIYGDGIYSGIFPELTDNAENNITGDLWDFRKSTFLQYGGSGTQAMLGATNRVNANSVILSTNKIKILPGNYTITITVPTSTNPYTVSITITVY